MNKQSKRTIIVLSVLLLIVLLIGGVSYAYYVAKVTGNESATTITADAGKMELIVNGGNSITADVFQPSSEPWATKTFTVTGTNTTNRYMPYTVNLVIDTNSFSNSAISYTLEAVNTSSNGLPADNVSITPISGTSTIIMGEGYFSNGNDKVHTYTLKMYYLESYTDQSADMNKTFNCHISVTASKGLDTKPIRDTSGANSPMLADNMIPVTYDNVNDVWIKADSTKRNWYDYNTQMWANAVTVTSSTRTTYNSATVGTSIPMDDIMGMWVWIPRYEYLTTNL